MREIVGNTTTTPVPKSDWAQPDPNKADYIKNKPNLNVFATHNNLASALQEAKEYTDIELATFDFIKVVDELPETGLPNKIYLVPNDNKSETKDNWLFENERLTDYSRTDLPSPIVGVSYTIFVDGEEKVTSVVDCDGYWFAWGDGAIVWSLSDGWRFMFDPPSGAFITSGTVSVRANNTHTSTEPTSQNLFDEYIWVVKDGGGYWEWITTKQLEVDLTPYATIDFVKEYVAETINSIPSAEGASF